MGDVHDGRMTFDATANLEVSHVIAADKIAHEFAMVYITNRYGAEVKGTMSISSAGGEVGGWCTVETVRLPA